MARREHIAKNRLAILPDLTPYEMFATPVPAGTVPPFLNGESNAPSRVKQVDGKQGQSSREIFR